MSTRLKLRRGTGAEHSAFTGEAGEITLNTSAKSVVVHDGSTAGGVQMARADFANIGPVVASIVPATDIAYSLGSPTHRWADIYVGNNTIHVGDSTTFSGTSLVIDGGTNPTSLTQLPTLMASKIVAKPFTYNPGTGAVTVRPSIEFQAMDGTSYPISFDTTTNTFSLDAAGNYGTGSLVAKKITLTNDAGTALRVDGNATLGYDSADALTVKATATFQAPFVASAAVTLGDGNDAVTVNAGGANPFLVTAANLTVDSSGNMIVGGNLTIRGTTTTIDSNTVNIGDNILVLNADLPGGSDPTENAGIQIARGTESAARWLWDEATDAWTPMGGAINNVSSLTVTNLTVTGSTTGVTASLGATGVDAGTYTNPTITVDTDGRIVSAVNGTAGTGTGGIDNLAGTVMVMLDEKIITSATNSVTFTGLNGDEDVEYEIEVSAVNNSGASAWYYARPNGDNTTNAYRMQTATASGATLAGGAGYTYGFYLGYADTGTSTFATGKMMAKSGGVRMMLSQEWQSVTGTTSAQLISRGQEWSNTSANITSLTVVATANGGGTLVSGFGPGSRVVLYARKKVGGTASNVTADFLGARTRRTTAGSWAAGSWQTINWEVSDYDSSGFWSGTSPARFTVPAGVNKVRVSAGLGMNAANVQMQIFKNGNGVALATSSNAFVNATTGVVPVVAGDYFYVTAYNPSTAMTVTNQANTWFDIEVVDPVPVAISGFGNNSTADYGFASITSSNVTAGLGVGNYVKFNSFTGNGISYNSSTGVFTLKAGKTYKLAASLFNTFSATNGQFYVNWKNLTTNTVVGTMGGSDNEASTLQQTPVVQTTAVFTPMVDTDVALVIAISSGVASLGAGMSSATIEQIGGPSSGLNYGPAGYASLKMSVNTVPAANSNFAFDTISGNLALNGNGVVLKAGRVYLLQGGAWMGFSGSTGKVQYGFHNGSAFIGNMVENYPQSSTANGASTHVASAIYAPSVDTTVTLRTAVVQAAASIDAGYTFFNVMELASTVDTFSTNETLTGKVWIDGKPIWRTVVNFGALPNATSKNVAHGITGMTFVTHYEGIATNGTTRITIPYAANTGTNSLAMSVDDTLINMISSYNWSTYTTAYVTIEYTK